MLHVRVAVVVARLNRVVDAVVGLGWQQLAINHDRCATLVLQDLLVLKLLLFVFLANDFRQVGVVDALGFS